MTFKASTSAMQTVGNAIAKQRKARKMTQAQLAEKIGLSNDAISRLERGKIVPSVLRLFELAEIFDCDVADLLSDASIRAPDQARQLTQMMARLNHQQRSSLLEIVGKMIDWHKNPSPNEEDFKK